jgi:abequosyltransferase
MTIKLSICIPTYNRGGYLEITLSNIIEQLNPGVEIVIMDGASSDDTKNIVESFQARNPAIKYIRGERNGGVDADLAACIEHAQGDYCWLMSSDDLFAENSVSFVMKEIASSDLSVLLGCRIDCSNEMKSLGVQSWIPNVSDSIEYKFSDPSALISYFDTVSSIGALFSYISCIIVHRSSWQATMGSEKFYGTNYAHVFRIFEMLKSGGILKYTEMPIVLCRMGNDSFSSGGLVNRYQIDLRGYAQIAEALFKENPNVLSAMLRVMTREHRWPRLLKIRAHCCNRTEWDEITRQLLVFGYAKYTLFICGILGSVKPAISFSVLVYEALKRRYRRGDYAK